MNWLVRMQDAVDYMEAKYGEKFEPDSSIGASVDQPYVEFWLVSASHPDEIAKAYYEDGDFSDNYFGILNRAKYQTFAQNVLMEYYPSAKIFLQYKASAFPGELNASSDFLEVLQQHPDYFYTTMYVFVNDTDQLNQEKTDALTDAFKSKMIHGSMLIYQMNEEEIGLLTDDTYEKYLDEHYTMAPEFSKVIK